MENKDLGVRPFWLFTILAIAVVLISIRDFKQRRRNKLLDYLLFSFTGLAGLVILLLWFATDHSATANNFNILWAFAPNLVFVFLIHNNRAYYAHYILFLLALLDLLAVLVVSENPGIFHRPFAHTGTSQCTVLIFMDLF
ncbi:MAG: hypothetical protein U5K51_03915 [Flavobacteriaceae bacterium]|nr:hypothetical protein [Flavobacteriaceae bacterium]